MIDASQLEAPDVDGGDGESSVQGLGAGGDVDDTDGDEQHQSLGVDLEDGPLDVGAVCFVEGAGILRDDRARPLGGNAGTDVRAGADIGEVDGRVGVASAQEERCNRYSHEPHGRTGRCVGRVLCWPRKRVVAYTTRMETGSAQQPRM